MDPTPITLHLYDLDDTGGLRHGFEATGVNLGQPGTELPAEFGATGVIPASIALHISDEVEAETEVVATWAAQTGLSLGAPGTDLGAGLFTNGAVVYLVCSATYNGAAGILRVPVTATP